MNKIKQCKICNNRKDLSDLDKQCTCSSCRRIKEKEQRRHKHARNKKN